MKSIDSFNFANQKALIRVDYNVPLDDNFNVTDVTRIVRTKETVSKILNDGGTIILMSHLGRPKGEANDKYSLRHIVGKVSEILGQEVVFAGDVLDPKTADVIAGLKPGSIALLENLRFHAEELDQVERDDGSQPDQEEHQGHEDERGLQQAQELLVDDHAEDRRQQDEEHGGGGHGGVHDEAVRHLGGEDGHHQHQRRQAEEDEDLASGVAEFLLNDIRDAAALVAHGEEHRREVVHRAHEDAAQQDPQQRGQPAELGGQHGPHDWPGARDRGEVVPEEHGGVRGDVVHAVLQCLGRTRALRVHAEGLVQELSVDEERQQEIDGAANQKKCGVHAASLLLVWRCARSVSALFKDSHPGQGMAPGRGGGTWVWGKTRYSSSSAASCSATSSESSMSV